MVNKMQAFKCRFYIALQEALFFILYYTAYGLVLLGRSSEFFILSYVAAAIWIVRKINEFSLWFRPRMRDLYLIRHTLKSCFLLLKRRKTIYLSRFRVVFQRVSFQVFVNKASKHAVHARAAIVRVLITIGFLFKIIRVILRSRTFGYAIVLLFAASGVMVCWQAYGFIRKLPSPRNIGKLNFPTSTHIYDRNGKMLYEIYSEQNRTPVKLDTLPDYVSKATIAIEDKEFYIHAGISPIGGMLRALRDSYLHNELQGGSTITQQLVKSALLTPERTLERKIKEIILALWTEQLYTKDQILEMYLNQVPYGGAAYGIEEAAKTFFGKSAAQLALEEAALLAGLPRAPSIYSPYVDPALAKSRRNDVLRRMLAERYISSEEFEAASAKPLAVIPPKVEINAPHFVFYVRQQLEQAFGASIVEEGGLRVTTTIDLEIQREAEKILREELAKVTHLNIQNGAVLVTKPDTGEILAMVGSVDYFQSPHGAFNVTVAPRQPGSSIKPIMYSLALENGYTAATMIDDSPLVIAIPGSEPYRPVNYDGRFHGRVPMRAALANSYNIPAVKVLQTLGVQRFVAHAEKMGIDTWKDPSRFGLSLSLGGGEVRMVDLVEAFGVFANGGRRVNLTGVRKIVDLKGNELDYGVIDPVPVLDPGVAYIISDILSDGQARAAAFGVGSYLEIPGYTVAVKTGTTNDLKDNWTVGYTPDYVVAVWVGNNDNSSMNQYLVSGITGAAPIWNRVMTYLLKNKYPNSPNAWFAKPANVIEQDCFGRSEVFLTGTERSSFCQPQQQYRQNRIVQAPYR